MQPISLRTCAVLRNWRPQELAADFRPNHGRTARGWVRAGIGPEDAEKLGAVQWWNL